MKKTLVLPFLVIMTVILLSVSVIFRRAVKNISKQLPPPAPGQSQIASEPTKTNPSPFVNVIGVIRTSGLTADEKQKFGLKYANFSVTDFSKDETENSKIYGYYLEKEDSFAQKYEGKCVRIKGILVKGWENIPAENFEKNGQYTYSMLAMDPTVLGPLKMTDCSPYITQERAEENFESISFRGILKHGVRPAPDVGYDYILELEKPYLDESNATGNPLYLKQIDAMPSENDIWIQMEEKIGEKVTLEGYYVWGYSESKYLQTHTVK